MGYASEQNPDGTWNILAVPIFSETTMKTLEGDEFTFTSAWFDDAIAWHQMKWVQDGYREPLNERHHSDRRGKEHAGRFLPTHTASFAFDDTEKLTVFADLQRIPDWTYQRIKRGEIEYVSVEANNVAWPRFSACALMSDTSPHHKYPPITIDEERVHARTFKPDGAVDTSVEGNVPLALVASSENPLRRVAPMKKKATSRTSVKDGDEVKYLFRFNDGASNTMEVSTDPNAYEFADDGDKGGEGDGGESASGLKAIKAAIEGATISVDEIGELKTLVDALASKLGGEGGDEETNTDDGENTPTEAMADGDKKAIEAMEKAGRLEGRLEAVEGQLDKATCFSEARTALEGYVFQDSELDAAYEFKGAEGVQFFVSERKKNGRKIPADSDAEITPETVTARDLPAGYEFSDEATVFAGQIAASREYDKSPGIRARWSRKDWIDNRTKPARDLARAGGND